MKVTVRSTSKKDTRAMLTIVHDGHSETRHCHKSGSGWNGWLLDRDKQKLQMLEVSSAELVHQIRMVGAVSKLYNANLLHLYQGGSTANESYKAHVQHEQHRAKQIIEKQRGELLIAEIKHAEREAEKAKQREAQMFRIGVVLSHAVANS